MFPHYITGPTQREEVLRERKIKRFLNFIKQNYTDFEEERLREKKGKMYVFTITSLIGGPPQREEILREIKMKRFLNFYYATMKFLRG